MNVFDLFAKLSLDSSEYDKGLSNAKSAGSALGNGLATAAKVGLAAVTAATGATVAFGTASVKTGMDFDKSMSQVAATMGVTVDQIDNLREFAQEMGRTTAFSATQAADALNYMALAGYDAEKSMEMLPNVLNLAAAGNMDLARASDMVTDTQTAFGLTTKRTAQMVDEMAKAASTGNTSVEQLGDAFLTVGGLAQELNGGLVELDDGTTATVDGVQELEIALTAMANAGIKGSEAGTHMRNMLTKLSDPTDEGTQALEAMGVAIFDDEGKMRSLRDIMGDLSGAMADMTQENKIKTVTALFNARDLSSAEALLNAIGQDWDDIGESILDAQGAAEQMAQTQLDNLTGDITLFKSALEGAQIAISDTLSPALREFVQFGTQGLSKLTKAFDKGGLDEAMEAFGGILSNGISMIIEKTPLMIKAGTQLLSAFIKGLLKNKNKIFSAAKEIVKAVTDTLSKEFPKLKSILDNIQRAFDAVFGFIESNGPAIKGMIEGILAGFLAYNAAITVFTSLQKGIGLVTTAIKLLNGELALTAAVNPYAALAASIGVIIGLMVALEEKERAEKQAKYDMIAAISEETQKSIDYANEYIDKMAEVYASNMNVKHSIEEEIKPEQDLIEELKNVVDENGNVKAGYEERAQAITGELAEAFGIEIKYQEGVIEKYGEVMNTLDQLIEKKKGEALLDANKQKYSEEMTNQVDLYNQMKDAQNEYNTAVNGYNEQLNRANEALDKINSGSITTGEAWALWDEIDDANLQMDAYTEKMDKLEEAVDSTSQAYYAGQDFISDYNNLLEATTSGSGDVEKAVTDMTNGIIESAPHDILKQQAEEATTYLQSLIDAYGDGVGVTEEQISEATERAKAAIDALQGAGQDGQAGYAEGLSNDTSVIDAAKKMVEDGLNAVATAQDSHSPSVKFMRQGNYAMTGYGEGMLSRVGWLTTAASGIIQKIETVFTRLTPKAKTWAEDMMDNFIKGIEKKIPALQESVAKAANVVKDNLGHSHPKEGPLSNDYTWMPDMMDLFMQGINDKKSELQDTISDAFNIQGTINADMSAAKDVAGARNDEMIISLLQEIRDNGTVIVNLEGDADRLFRVIQNKATSNYRLTGQRDLVTV
jgi:TP901 family phage tail tape measure protein